MVSTDIVPPVQVRIRTSFCPPTPTNHAEWLLVELTRPTYTATNCLSSLRIAGYIIWSEQISVAPEMELRLPQKVRMYLSDFSAALTKERPTATFTAFETLGSTSAQRIPAKCAASPPGRSLEPYPCALHAHRLHLLDGSFNALNHVMSAAHHDGKLADPSVFIWVIAASSSWLVPIPSRFIGA